MPGIVPMKVITVGTQSQARIAQACDRCRSKKIRCDGIRPCCSQCATVGFECKTSDKLSRRAFPRGYTESLEERVRQLEAEVRELKEALDEKDELIDIMSKIQNGASGESSRRPSDTLSHSNSQQQQQKQQLQQNQPQRQQNAQQQQQRRSTSMASSSTARLPNRNLNDQTWTLQSRRPPLPTSLTSSMTTSSMASSMQSSPTISTPLTPHSSFSFPRKHTRKRFHSPTSRSNSVTVGLMDRQDDLRRSTAPQLSRQKTSVQGHRPGVPHAASEPVVAQQTSPITQDFPSSSRRGPSSQLQPPPQPQTQPHQHPHHSSDSLGMNLDYFPFSGLNPDGSRAPTPAHLDEWERLLTSSAGISAGDLHSSVYDALLQQPLASNLGPPSAGLNWNTGTEGSSSDSLNAMSVVSPTPVVDPDPGPARDAYGGIIMSTTPTPADGGNDTEMV